MAPHDVLRALDETIRARSILQRSAEPHPAAAAMVRTFSELARESLAAGVAALYAYESQQPEVSSTKARGLRDLYAVDDARSLAYFAVHEAADVRHRRGEREALATCLAAGAPPEELRRATRQALDAYWGLLDGVCEEVGLAA